MKGRDVARYASMTIKQLQTHLIKREVKGQITHSQRINLLEVEEEKRRKVKIMNHKLGAAERYWRPIIGALIYERRNAYHSWARFRGLGNREAEVAAYAAYLELLRVIEARFANSVSIGLGPRQTALLVKEQTGREIPNDGDHWTDWVGPNQRERVVALFRAIPYRKGVKCKQPFPRNKMPKSQVHLLDPQQVAAMWSPDDAMKDRLDPHPTPTPKPKTTNPGKLSPFDDDEGD